MSNPQLLLMDDVADLGRKGEIVSVKPGYARNFLIPQKRAVVADKFTLKLQARLQEERAKQAEVDRKAAEEYAKKLIGTKLKTLVKIDQTGHMYGSVTSQDIAKLLEEKGIALTRKNVVLPRPIKTLGEHSVQLSLAEGVPAEVTLVIESETPLPPKKEKAPEEPKAEATAEEEQPAEES